MRPAARMDTDGRAQVYIGGVRAFRAHIRPPLEKFGLPVLERPLQHFVATEVDIVGDLVRVGNVHRLRLLYSVPVELCPTAGAEYREGACFTHGVGPDENPVLPRR